MPGLWDKQQRILPLNKCLGVMDTKYPKQCATKGFALNKKY